MNPSSSEQRVKGTLVLARMTYLRGKGEPCLRSVLDGLDPSDARQLRSLLPGSWYPLGLMRRLEERIAKALNQGRRRDLFLDIGRAAATAALGSGAQRVYVRPGDPQFVLGRTPYIYASSFSDGHRSYESTSEDSGVVRTTKRFQDAHEEECLITAGWLEQAIALSGGQRITVTETQCGVRSAPWCEFHCGWRLPDGARLAG